MAKIIYSILIAAFAVFFLSTNTFAQDFPGDCIDPTDPNDTNCNPDSVPIDGGVSILLAASVAYVVKKIHDKRKQNKQEVAS